MKSRLTVYFFLAIVFSFFFISCDQDVSWTSTVVVHNQTNTNHNDHPTGAGVLITRVTISSTGTAVNRVNSVDYSLPIPVGESRSFEFSWTTRERASVRGALIYVTVYYNNVFGHPPVTSHRTFVVLEGTGDTRNIRVRSNGLFGGG